ncbi:MAG TPA: nucleotidyltransferase family protein [Anaeromyxobacteraceae bacterium]|nr:nucleotidyltransferase family protein [Anaeromyxobacteraceae bacterium]
MGECAGAHRTLASWCVRQFAGRRSSPELDLHLGARAAGEAHLAGLFLLGLEEMGFDRRHLPPEAEMELEWRRQGEIAADRAASRLAREVLAALVAVGIRPVVLKGRPLAERLWPQAWMRPCGDLDLLVPEGDLGASISALARLGYRAIGGDVPGRWRPPVSGVDLFDDSRRFAVDLHIRPFRSIGHGIAASELLRRSRPGLFLGVPIRVLEPADDLLCLLVHAARHGASEIKWRLDLAAAALRHGPEVWESASRLAVAAGVTRPFWCAARCVRGLAPPLPPPLELRMRPSPVARAALARLVPPRGDATPASSRRWSGHAREWFLEDRATVRWRRAGGFVQRVLRRSLRRFVDPPGPSVGPSGAASRRWVEASLKSGRSGPVWLTIAGSSMTPSMAEGDRVLAAPVAGPESLRVGEIVLVRRGERLVVHRLVRLSGDLAFTRGDADRQPEDPAVPTGEVLATVLAVARRAPSRIGPSPFAWRT